MWERKALLWSEEQGLTKEGRCLPAASHEQCICAFPLVRPGGRQEQGSLTCFYLEYCGSFSSEVLRSCLIGFLSSQIV